MHNQDVVEHNFDFGSDGQMIEVVIWSSRVISVFISQRPDVDSGVFIGNVKASKRMDVHDRKAVFKVAKRVINKMMNSIEVE